jgi:hypothetical protein
LCLRVLSNGQTEMSAPPWVPRRQPASVIPQPARCPCRSGKCARLRPTVAPCSSPPGGIVATSLLPRPPLPYCPLFLVLRPCPPYYYPSVSCSPCKVLADHRSQVSGSHTKVTPTDSPSHSPFDVRCWAFDVRCSFGRGHRPLHAFRGCVSWASRPQTEKRRHPRVPPLRAALTRPSKLCDADHSVSPSTGARSPTGRRGISGCRGEARWGKWEPDRPVDRVGLIPGMCQTTDAVACARRTDVS